jgi:hypothetical protein
VADHEPRPPSWGRVWLEARAAGRNPVAALVAAGLCAADEVAASETAVPSRRPPGDRPRRGLKCHEGLDPEHYAQVEAELAARASRSAAVVPAPAIVAEPSRAAGRVRVVAVGPGPRAGLPGDVGDRAGDGDRVSYDTRLPGPRAGH